eukprot:CAMPEP_0170573250 /NCGR_PEP_ID=MMETSP0224-20130122/2665_1 /TAXON_ID=285029 /ORGANISM="Togula jolla, Strain CCCM 725" /LENGTH=139 /DNA_ID=CAMNT_0010895825 /DNA_START=444 /DNA_END=860 /DNA_ORIENTATION=-
MDADLREAPFLKKLDDGVTICCNCPGRRSALRTAKAAVVKEEHTAAVGKVEVKPMRLVGHCLIVRGVGVAPHDHVTRRMRLQCAMASFANVRQRDVVPGRRQDTVLLWKQVGAIVRNKHAVDLAASRDLHPAMAARVAD